MNNNKHNFFSSRDKTNLDEIITKEKLNIVLRNAGLADRQSEQNIPNQAGKLVSKQ